MSNIKQMIRRDIRSRILDLDELGTSILAFHLVGAALLLLSSLLEIIYYDAGFITGVTIGFLVMYCFIALTYLVTMCLKRYKENRSNEN